MATGSRISETERQQIETMARNNVSTSEIVAVTGRSRSTVSKIRSSIDLTGTGPAEHRAKDNASPVPRSRPRLRAVATAKGRQSAGMFTEAALKTVLPPVDEKSGWTTFELSARSWQEMGLAETMRVLSRISPDISRAMWDYTILGDSGHEVQAFNPGKQTINRRGQAILDRLSADITRYHGGMKVQTARMITSLLTRGMLIIEGVPNRNARRMVDIVVPDPAQFAFQRREDPDRGEVWVLGQWQNGKFVLLDYPNIISIPLHPDPDSPYGRPLIAPAVFPTIFLIGLMHDLRRVVAQQGYTRTDIKILLEPLMARLQAAGELSEEELIQRVNEVVADVSSFYAMLDPDDAYVHTDDVELDRANGAVDASVITGAVDLIDTLERQAMRALKSMPLLMGDSEGATESNSNRQWEIFVKGIKSIQQIIETAMKQILTLALTMEGVNAEGRITFAEIRETEELKDEQTLAQRIENQVALRNEGFITQDEASLELTGHVAAAPGPVIDDEPNPVLNDPDVVADPGSDRIVRRRMTRRVTVGDDLVRRGRDAWEDTFAGTEYQYLLDAEMEDDE